MMIITFRDMLGYCAVEVNPVYGISFLEREVYFTDTNGKDYRISVDAVVNIDFKCSC